MGRHSNPSEDETHILAEVVDAEVVEAPRCGDLGGMLGGPIYECTLPPDHKGVHGNGIITWDRTVPNDPRGWMRGESLPPGWTTRSRHFDFMFKGMHDTDEQAAVEPEPTADPEPQPKKYSLGLVVAFAMAVGIVIGGVIMAVADYAQEPKVQPQRIPVTITKTVPPPITSETP